jgi:hypothetical protein
MPRKAHKVKPGQGFIRVNVMIDADALVRVDAEAATMTKEDEYHRVASRSEAVRSLITDGLKYRAERRGKRVK